MEICPDFDEQFSVVESFLRQKSLVAHHLESYNDFVVNGIRKVVESNSEIETDDGRKFIFVDPRVERPRIACEERDILLFPHDCMEQDIYYCSTVYCDVVEKNGEHHQLHKDVMLGKIPSMIGSVQCNTYEKRNDPNFLAKIGECPMDIGGYFITRGSKGKRNCMKRTVVGLERKTPNTISVFRSMDKKKPEDYRVEVRSYNPKNSYTSPFVIYLNSKFILTVSSPRFSETTPLPLLTRSMGFSDNQVAKWVFKKGEKGHKEFIQSLTMTLEGASHVPHEQSKCLEELGKRCRGLPENEDVSRELVSILQDEIVSHIGPNLKKKMIYICYMIRQLFLVKLGIQATEDRDNFANERLICVGHQFYCQFLISFKLLQKDMKKRKDPINSIKSTIITNNFLSCLNKNVWGKRGESPISIAQLIETNNYQGLVSAMRKITVQIEDGSRLTGPRNLHSSHWGAACAAETPEGKRCGYTKSLCTTAQITLDIDPIPIEILAKDIGCISVDDELLDTEDFIWKTKIFLNGNWIGICDNPEEFVETFKIHRRRVLVHPTVSIYHNPQKKEVVIWSDSGRFCRPLIIVDNGVPRLTKRHVEKLRNGEWTWNSLIEHSIIEYIDKQEEELCLVAQRLEDVTPDCTHSEINPLTAIYGINASIVPFPNHNQAPRNTYQVAMAKQAIGIPFLNFQRVSWTSFNTLCYPQRPLTLSLTADMAGYKDLPSGFNAVVAIMPWKGYNQEDSICVNKSAVDRGFGRIFKHLNYCAYIRDYNREWIDIPETAKCENVKGNYDKLECDGIIGKGMVVQHGDVLIAKVVKNDDIHRKPFVDASVIYKEKVEGVVDKVVLGTTCEGTKFVKIMIIQKRDLIVGDKMASRYGQKGTVGKLFRSEDMPFTQDGIVPDILMNPLALPSRMTIGQLIETISSKKICGSIADRSLTELYSDKEWDDCSGFRRVDVKEIYRYLEKMGHDGWCDTTMFNGETGEMMQGLIFCGPVYYQRLKHMVIDKGHARARGPRQILTRQPREGRAAEGGFRLGVMERACLGAHGVSGFIKDRFHEQSDPYQIWVCRKCGLQAIYDKEIGIKECRLCSSSELSHVKLTYASKLLAQELMGMNIVMRMLPEPVSGIKFIP